MQVGKVIGVRRECLERERKELPNYVKPQTSQFCNIEAHRCYTWLVSFSGEMVIYTFLLGFFTPSHQKKWYEY